MNSFIQNLRKIVFNQPTISDEYENVTYKFESVYPDKETMEKVEKSLKQRKKYLVNLKYLMNIKI